MVKCGHLTSGGFTALEMRELTAEIKNVLKTIAMRELIQDTREECHVGLTNGYRIGCGCSVPNATLEPMQNQVLIWHRIVILMEHLKF